MKSRLFLAAVVLTLPVLSGAETVKQTYRANQKLTIAPGGTFVLENPVGNVEVFGDDVENVEAKITTIVTAPDKASADEGRRLTTLVIGGDTKTRIARTVVAPGRKQWSTAVHWSVRVPRQANVRIISNASDRIKLSDVNGSVRVRNFNGNIVLERVLGPTLVESVNGSISFNTPRPRGNVTLKTVNGGVTAIVAADGDYRWVAETLRGDIQTNLPARGAFFGSVFRGSINAPGGPTITTASLMGNIHLLGAGAASGKTASIRKIAGTTLPASSPAQPAARSSQNGPPVLRQGVIPGAFTYTTNIGDVRIQEVHGDAQIFTGAGEVQIGAIGGVGNIRSHGGPLQIGEVSGPLTATTRAGDVLVDSARKGGRIQTQGGTIRLLYSSGPMRLTNGGGDIIVRQANGPITATTKSGDIAITVDGRSKSEKLEATTEQGNIVLNVPPKFGADIEATIITGDPKADTIVSDIPGLSVSRDQVGGKTRVRAVGKINGGGEKVTLQATSGDIRISAARAEPTVVVPR